jgi:hypothetical protein
MLPRKGLRNPVYYEPDALATGVVSRPLPSNGCTSYSTYFASAILSNDYAAVGDLLGISVIENFCQC